MRKWEEIEEFRGESGISDRPAASGLTLEREARGLRDRGNGGRRGRE